MKEVIGGEINSARNLFRPKPKENQQNPLGCFMLIIRCACSSARFTATTDTPKQNTELSKRVAKSPKDSLVLSGGTGYMKLEYKQISDALFLRE